MEPEFTCRSPAPGTAAINATPGGRERHGQQSPIHSTRPVCKVPNCLDFRHACPYQEGTLRNRYDELPPDRYQVQLALTMVGQTAAISATDVLVRFGKLPGVILTDQALMVTYNVVNGGLFIACVPVSLLFASILIGLYDRSPRLYAFLAGPPLAFCSMFLADPLLGISNGLDAPERGFQVFGFPESAFPFANEVIGYALQLSTVLAVGCSMGLLGWLVARLTCFVAHQGPQRPEAAWLCRDTAANTERSQASNVAHSALHRSTGLKTGRLKRSGDD